MLGILLLIGGFFMMSKSGGNANIMEISRIIAFAGGAVILGNIIVATRKNKVIKKTN